jgi:ABC-type multidrug transport system fused ATPase/permease subunit
VALARALYDTDSDLFVLDDPLSAVDAHVSRAIFDQAIKGLLAGKTRVLVLSSNYQYLPKADHIIVMDGGRVAAQGSYAELQASHPEYLSPDDDGEGGGGRTLRAGSSLQHRRGSSAGEDPATRDRRASSVPLLDFASPAGDLIAKEERETGSVSWGVYAQYFSGAAESVTGGSLLGLAIVLVFMLGQATRVLVDIWLTDWAHAARAQRVGGRTEHLGYYTGVYWAICGSTVLLTLGRSYLVLWSAVKICSRLHAKLLRGVLRAPVNLYFDVTPIGRILNRFSKDLDHVDQPLPETMLQVCGERT